jgi:uncharacterized membrane protein YoaK (UPF0700 family)
MVLDEHGVRDPADEIRPATKRLLVAFLVLTLLAVNQLFVLADVADRYWVWTIRTELTAAFLGSAYTAGAVLSALALREDRWSRIRVPVITVTVFTVLTAVATLVHHHRLHLWDGGPVARGASWIWLAVYLVIPFACAWVVYRQESVPRPVEPPARPIPGWLGGLLLAEGTALFLAGAVLFGGGLMVHHRTETATNFWPWVLTPLSAEVIGAWLMAFGVAAGLALLEGDLGRLFVAAVTYTVFGATELVAVFWYRPQVEGGDPWLWAYVAVLVLVTATGAFGAWAARRPVPGEVAAASG